MKRFLRVAVGFIISAICLVLAFRAVPLRQVWTVATGVSIGTMLACVTIGCSTLFLRSLRWRILLQQGAEPFPLGLTFAVNAAGQMGNAILPARLGDLFRVTNLGRAGVSSGFVLATVLVERVLDTGFLVLMSAVALTTFGNLPPRLADAARMLAAAAVLGLLVSLLLPRFEALTIRVVNSIAPARWHGRLVSLVKQFLSGLRSLHELPRVGKFLLFTFVIWLLDAAGFYILGNGLSITITPPLAVLVIAAVALSSVLPAAPGNVGVYQMVAVSVLAPFGVARPAALALALIMQAVTTVALILCGLPSLWFLSVKPPQPELVPLEEVNLQARV